MNESLRRARAPRTPSSCGVAAMLLVLAGSGCSDDRGARGPAAGAMEPGEREGSALLDAASEAWSGPRYYEASAPIVFFDDVASFDAAAAESACAREVHPIVRDFRGYTSASGARHPDFEGTFNGAHGLVEKNLGADQKPVYAPTGSTSATTGPSEFIQWYRDIPGVNQRFDDVVLPLLQDKARPGTFVYDTDEFFPIDGRGFDDGTSGHNFHFTTETHLEFPYRGGEYFTFRGDDDVFLFINGHLALDLGGVHPPQQGTISLDDSAGELELVKNRTYRMDVFQAERHTTYSTFHLETTLQCITNVEIR